MSGLWISVLIITVFAANSDKLIYKQAEIDSPVGHVVYCGKDQDTILILSEENIVYRSETAGINWKPVSFPASPSPKILKIVNSQADPKLIGLFGNSGVNYYSEDCGKNIKPLNYANPMERFMFHSKMRNWALALSYIKCTKTQENCVDSRSLYLTKDLGVNWEMISTNVVQFSWGYTGLKKDLNKRFPMERIYIVRHSDSYIAPKTGWSYDVDFIKSDDFFNTADILVPHGNKFVIRDSFILVATGIENTPEEVTLFISSEQDFDAFHEAEFPIKKFGDYAYNVLDTSEQSVFIHVNHYGSASKYGTIFVSDATGSTFSVSLMYNVRGDSGLCDFTKISGLEGIYIANVYEKDHLNVDVETVGVRGLKKFQTTLISFDKGGQ